MTTRKNTPPKNATTLDKVKKVQFAFSSATLDTINILQRLSNASSMAEVIRNALYVYNWAVKMILQGGEIFAVDKDGKPHKVILPNISVNDDRKEALAAALGGR